MTTAFAREFLGQFQPQDGALPRLAREYHEVTERYDRTVCTGPIGRDGGILPAGPEQSGLINRHAIEVFERLAGAAREAGFEPAELRQAIRDLRPTLEG